jgi:hypothetical protein
MHPLFFYSGIAAAILVADIFKPKLLMSKPFTVFCILSAVLFAAVYVLRMIYLFPDTPPMDYSENNLINFIISIFK